MRTRINDFKTCTQILNNTKLANVTDEVYNDTFHKFVVELSKTLMAIAILY